MFNDFFFQIFRWEFAVAPSTDGFQHFSFVNGVNTAQGGPHVDHILELIQNALFDKLNKKNKGGIKITNTQVVSRALK